MLLRDLVMNEEKVKLQIHVSMCALFVLSTLREKKKNVSIFFLYSFVSVTKPI
jgi:hypothetical protein